jgi:SAM-dependent methyltransferase
MTNEDVDYIRQLLTRGLVRGPCLELGVGLEGANNRDLLRAHGIEHYGSDIVPGPVVDFVIDLEAPLDQIKRKVARVGPFGSVLVLNVLEHTFDPLRILDNVFALLAPGGSCVIITPAVWTLHDYPVDCWRILPGFYVEYAKRRRLTLVEDAFQFVGHGKVHDFRAPDGTFALPRPGSGKANFTYSKAIHKLFNTFGRGMAFPSHVACGAVIRNSPPAPDRSVQPILSHG